MEPFYFTPFGRKRLQAAPEAARETLPNGVLDNHLEKLLEGIFWPKSYLLVFRNDIESLLKLLLLANVPVYCNGMYKLLHGHLDDFSLENH